MSFPEGPPTGEPQRYATDGRDVDGTSPTAAAEDSPTAALRSDDPSATSAPDDRADSAESDGDATGTEADLEEADRDQTDREDGRGQRASQPGGALGPGTTATGAGTALD